MTDARDAAYDPFYGSFDQDKMIGIIDDLEIKCHFEVCPVCDGRGKHVHPGIDSLGLSADDFAEDPDFEEAYFSGQYDVTCYKCRGKNVVPVANEDDETAELLHAMIRDHEEHVAEMEAERRMGA